MNDRQSVTLIREQLSADEAMSAVAGVTGGSNIEIDRTVYYPYHWYRVVGSAPRLFGRRPVSFNCLVDARNGVASTSDPFAVEQTMLPGNALLAARQNASEVATGARRYVTHALGRGLRTLANFDVDLEHQGIVYKVYWVFRCDGAGVLVDGMTGALCPLGR